jgi:hypothetical protein
MSLKTLTKCTEAECGHKAISLILLSQSNLLVPESWMWLAPRRKEDFEGIIKSGINTIILRASEPIDSIAQELSGNYPSQILQFTEVDDLLDSWIKLPSPVIVQHYVPATFGGAAHIRMIEKSLIIHLLWSSDIEGIMNGSDSGKEVWFGDLPNFEKGSETKLVARSSSVPKTLLKIIPEFTSQMRVISQKVSLPFEVEWVVDYAGEIVFLQLLKLDNLEERSEFPWIHPDSLFYALEK